MYELLYLHECVCLSMYLFLCVGVSQCGCVCVCTLKKVNLRMYYIRFQTLIVILCYIKGKNEHNTLEFIHYKVALL